MSGISPVPRGAPDGLNRGYSSGVLRRLLGVGALAAGVLFLPPELHSASQNSAHQQGTTDIFVCGEDEKVQPIPVHWTTAILAGDGRLSVPCPDGHHAEDHRERREAALLGEGRFSGDGELRWRAAQAQARNSDRPALFPVVGERNPPPPRSSEYIFSQFDGLGGFMRVALLDPPCWLRELVFEDTATAQRWQPGRLFRMIDETWGSTGRARPGTPPQRMSELASRRRIALDGAYAIGALLSRPGPSRPISSSCYSKPLASRDTAQMRT